MNVRQRISNLFAAAFTAAVLFSTLSGQSNDANFPTPLTSNVATGTIKARDIGDSRLTTYYYAFEGGQGDIFINVTTKNFNGDIDVFAVDAMRPLTKMLIFADTSSSETGRLIYLRKPERLLLRIQGRSPDDDPATFQIKFGGSFVAMKSSGGDDVAPTVDSDQTGSVRVNSVGTIIETPRVERAVDKPIAKVSNEPAPPTLKAEAVAKKPANKKLAKASVVVTETVKERPAKDPKVAVVKKESSGKKLEPQKPSSEPDPLAAVRLVVSFKNGDRLERPLPEVLKFSVDKGVLTVISKDGAIRRYSMVDVAKVTIE